MEVLLAVPGTSISCGKHLELRGSYEQIVPDELAEKGRVEEWLSAGEVDLPHSGFRQ